MDFNAYKKYLTKQTLLISLGFIVVVVFFISIPNLLTHDISIINDSQEGLLGKFMETRLCAHDTTRPIAVMLSSDPEARPLSAVGQANIVFEMPVTGGGVTRMMGVYQCTRPEEIGSIRSARLDFIPLVQGLDAIYAHWGGEAKSLEQLNRGVTDNVNGLIYDGTVYYRKKNIYAPHNGFSSFQRLFDKALELGFSTSIDTNSVYKYKNGKSEGEIVPPGLYGGDFYVSWEYDPQTNSYFRFRDNKIEKDANTDEQVKVENVVQMHTTWTPINVDYINVTTIGTGPATIYKNGTAIEVIWSKPTASSKLVFLDEKKNEIPFTKGQVWINIITDL